MKAPWASVVSAPGSVSAWVHFVCALRTWRAASASPSVSARTATNWPSGMIHWLLKPGSVGP